MANIVEWLQTPVGRLLRAAAGLMLLIFGLFWIGGFIGTAVGFLGTIPLVAALRGECLIAPLLGADIHGHRHA